MNILVVYPYIPYPLDRGTFQRNFHLLRELAQVHTVDLIALSENGERLDQSPVFESFCREVTFITFCHPAWQKLIPERLFQLTPSTLRHWESPELADTIRDRLSRRSYELVHVCDIVMAQYFLREHEHIPLSIDRSRVDLQFQLQQTAFNAKSWKDKLLAWENMAKLWIYEKKIARRCQLQVLCGPDDETFVRKHISRRVPVEVVANGVDLDFFKALPAGNELSNTPAMLFCGAMDYTPNVDALRWYFAEIHDQVRQALPELHIWIVGKSPTDEVMSYGQLGGVTVTGSVEDVRPYYRRSWLQMVPLRIGGGTRLKIVESLAIGTPVVSTTIGAQGLGLQHDKHALLADSAEEFAGQIIRLCRDAGLRQNLRSNGIEAANERFGWTNIGRRLAFACQRLSSPKPDRTWIMDVPFDRITMAQTLDRIGQMIDSGAPHYLATANVDFLVQSRTDRDLRRILHKAHCVVCDGTPLVWLSHLLGHAIPERVAGSDLVPQLLARAETAGWSVFFLGGQEEVLDQAVSNVKREHPKLRVAGSYSPPFAPFEKMDHKDICSRIREARPDIVLVSFGCPKQEKWIAHNYNAAGASVCIGVGATIDFLAGTVKRAPRWMQVAGLEWVFRLAQEPRRLAKRYLKDVIYFCWGSLLELARRPQSSTTTSHP